MNRMKKRTKILIAAAAVAAASIATASACYLCLPSGYISLDLNPSIELHTNRLNDVVSIEAVNEDAKALLEGYKLRDRDVDDVIEDIVDRMVLNGYLAEGKDANILVSVEKGTVKPEAVTRMNERIESYLNYRSVNANLVSQSIDMDDDLHKRAQEQQISAGKLSVIDRLVAGDPNLRPEDLRETNVQQLITFAREKNISLDLLEDRLDDMDDRYDDNAIIDGLENRLDDADDSNNGNNNTSYHDDDYDDYDDDYDDFDDHDDYNRPVQTQGNTAPPVQPVTPPVYQNNNDDDHYDDDYNDYDDDNDYDYDDDNDDYDDNNDDYDDD